jgi:hypothetical protein
MEVVHGIVDAQRFFETSLCIQCGKPARSWCDACRSRGLNRVPHNNGIATPFCVSCESQLLICRDCQVLSPLAGGGMDINEIAFREGGRTAQLRREAIKQAQALGHNLGEPPICLRDPTSCEVEAYRLRCQENNTAPLPAEKLCAVKTPGEQWKALPIEVVFPAAPAEKWLVAHVDAQWRPGDAITLPVYGPVLPPNFILPPGVPHTW